MKFQASSRGGMELARFGLVLRAAGTSAPRKTSEMRDSIEVTGVTASAEATREPSIDLLPLSLTFSEEERRWTECASSEGSTSDKLWGAVRRTGRRAWLWLLILSLNFLNCGALGSVKKTSQLYSQGPLARARPSVSNLTAWCSTQQIPTFSRKCRSSRARHASPTIT